MITFTDKITDASVLATKHFTPCEEHKATWTALPAKGRWGLTQAKFAAALYSGECDKCCNQTRNTFLWALTTLPKSKPTQANWWYVGLKIDDCLTETYPRRRTKHGDAMRAYPNCCYAAKLEAWYAMAGREVVSAAQAV